MLSVKELMKPRYKVYKPYPEMDKQKHFVGQIIQLDLKEGEQWYTQNIYSKFYDAYFDRYPHIFSKLHWSVDRDMQDFPDYLRAIYVPGLVVKIADKGNERYCDVINPQSGEVEEVCYMDWLPATEAEYLAQQTPTHIKKGV